MATFAVGRPVPTSTPTIAVDPGLPLGAHRFQLEVIDSVGNRSQPDIAVVTVTVQRPVITVPLVLAPPVLAPPVLAPTRPIATTTPRAATTNLSKRSPAPTPRTKKRSKPK